jgi:hypothetical protein
MRRCKTKATSTQLHGAKSGRPEPNAVIREIHRTWNRPEAAELAQLYTMVAPNYRAVMESYQKALEVSNNPS